MSQINARLLLTSDASTQLTGPKLNEKTILSIKIIAIPALCAAKLVTPSPGGKEATMADRMEKRATLAAHPKRRGFFLPTVSRMSVMKLFRTKFRDHVSIACSAVKWT